jgi:hypothetical protein
MKFGFVVLTVFCAVLFSVCENGDFLAEDNSASKSKYKNSDNGNKKEADNPFNGVAVQKVNYNNDENVVIEIDGLNNHSIYLVRVNTSGKTVNAADTGAVISYSPSYSVTSITNEDMSIAKSMGGGAISGMFYGKNGQTITRYDPVGFNEEIYDAIRSGRLRHEEPLNETNNSLLRSVSGLNASVQNYTVGSTKKQFHVRKENGVYEPNKVSATLRAQGTHCNIWVVDKNYSDSSRLDNDNKITSAQARAMAEKFDAIYSKETAVFGYEYGGGPGDPVGGIDGDKAVQILVYDIFDDYYRDQTGGVLGYFLSGDEFSQIELYFKGYFSTKSNEAEMFYIDAHFTDIAPDVMYSTLVHEFQHMIHFNKKTKRLGGNKTSAVWFNEMLSILAEDLIDPLIGITIDNPAHPVNIRVPTFLRFYNYADPTVWLDGDNVLISYANAYALGAYLVRNFGGVDFVNELMSNDYVDIASIDAALRSDVNSTQIDSFTEALSHFGEALLFNREAAKRPSGVFSFNNTVTRTIGGTSYTFYGFDIYELEDSGGNPLNDPLIWDTNKTYSLHPRTLKLQTNKSWQGIKGGFSVTLRPPPAGSGVDMYIVVR